MGGTSTSAYVIGSMTGNALRLSSAGQITDTIGTSETIAAPLLLMGNYSISVTGTSAATLNLTAALSGSNASTLTVSLTETPRVPRGT